MLQNYGEKATKNSQNLIIQMIQNWILATKFYRFGHQNSKKFSNFDQQNATESDDRKATIFKNLIVIAKPPNFKINIILNSE